MQVWGADSDEIFALTMKAETFRAVLCKASAENMGVFHYDVKTANLNTKFSEELNMNQILEFEDSNKSKVL